MATEDKAPKEVTFDYLVDITDDFSDEIGKGAFGTVYKGTWEDGRVIAVKRLHENAPVPRDKAFNNEVRNIMHQKHENIVQLIACCSEEREKTVERDGIYHDVDVVESILCYEYFPMGSLYDNLFAAESSIEWNKRFKIIKGICNGLLYLHSLPNPIIHLNLKPQNILLDDKMVPKISDFGLSRLFGQQSLQQTQNVVGACGYMAPEYVYNGHVSAEADIYSLGLLILQITTEEKNTPHQDHRDAREFVKQVREKWTEEHVTSEYAWLDPKSLEEIMTCIQMGLRCVELERKDRPSIHKVVDRLTGKRAS